MINIFVYCFEIKRPMLHVFMLHFIDTLTCRIISPAHPPPQKKKPKKPKTKCNVYTSTPTVCDLSLLQNQAMCTNTQKPLLFLKNEEKNDSFFASRKGSSVCLTI